MSVRISSRCLDADGKGLLQLHEVHFLDDWDMGQVRLGEAAGVTFGVWAFGEGLWPDFFVALELAILPRGLGVSTGCI